MRKVPYTLLLILIFALVIESCRKKDSGVENPQTPVCVNNTAPATGTQVNPGSSITLSWSAATNATSYDVYLGTTSVPTTVFASNVTSTSVTYTVPNAASVTYYWYVVPKNNNGGATGCTSKITSFATGTPINIQAPQPFGFYIIGYFPDYRAIADVPDVKFRMCNVVNYAFATVNTSNTLTIGSTTHMVQVITKAKANGAKVMLSIANPGTGNNFKTMAATSTGRNTFVKDVMNKMRQYNFDGADIDWEFPRTDDGTHLTFTALMKELSDSLHRDAKYYLTAALTAGKYGGAIRDAIQTEVFAYADFFNIMAYDDFSTTTAFKQHSDYNLAVVCLNYWRNTRGMPKEKAVLGFPAYGRPSGITQSGTTLAYRDILTKGGSSQTDSAFVTTTAFPNGFMIYYNGQPTVKKKTMLAKDMANGVMMWEKWHDAHDGNSLLKAVNDTLGRSY